MSLFFHSKRGFYRTTPYRLSGALTAFKGVVFVYDLPPHSRGEEG